MQGVLPDGSSVTYEQAIGLGVFLLAFGGAIAGATRFAVSRGERVGRELATALREESDELRQLIDAQATGIREAFAAQLTGLRETLEVQLTMRAQIFEALRANVEKLTDVTVDHGARLAVLREMADQWLQRRLHPNGKDGDG